MNNSEQPMSGHIVIGVDTHKHKHVAAVLDTIGGILATPTISTDTGGSSICSIGRAHTGESWRSESKAPAPTAPPSPRSCAALSTRSSKPAARTGGNAD